MQTNSATTGPLSPSGIIVTPKAWARDYTVPALANLSPTPKWHSRAHWEQHRDRSDAELQHHRQTMRDACEQIEVLDELETTDDYLQQEVHGGGV